MMCLREKCASLEHAPTAACNCEDLIGTLWPQPNPLSEKATSMASFQHTSGLHQPPPHTAVIQALEYVFGLNCLSSVFLLFIQNFISFTDSLNWVSKSKPEKAM